MVAIKSLSEISRKWAEVTPGRAAFYEAGVRNPRTPWAAAAAAASANQKAAVAAASGRDAYAAGVRKAGDEKWSRKAIALGPARFSTGVAAAQPDFEAGFSKFHSAIGALSLPARGPKGAEGNYTRSRNLGDALHKLALGGGA